MWSGALFSGKKKCRRHGGSVVPSFAQRGIRMKDKALPGIGEDRNGLLDGIRVFALDMDGTV